MGSKEKLLARFISIPSDFTWNELKRLLESLGYEENSKGKTSGSRVIFKGKDLKPIMLHKPHPGNIVKKYALRQILENLKNDGIL